MAEGTISQIKVGNITYDICDVVARDYSLIAEKIYPVGSIYLSLNNTNPSELFGFGTWQELEAGYALWTSKTITDYGKTAAATNTGDWKLTADQSGLPSHTHTAIDTGHTHDAAITSGGNKLTNYWGGYSTSSTGFIASNNTNASGFTPRGNGQTTGTGKAIITVNSTTAANAKRAHSHETGDPARIYIHAWKRIA